MRITFLRHGKTKGNLEHAFIGRTDQPLCVEGRQELTCAKEHGRYPLAELVIVSPMKRCLETAQILYPSVTAQIVEGLRETDFGDFEGKTHRQLKAFPQYHTFLQENGKNGFPNGETLEGADRRMRTAWEQVVPSLFRSGKTEITVVAHGGTVMNLLSAYGCPKRDYYDWQCENGDGWLVEVTPEQWGKKRFSVVGKLSQLEGQT